MLYNRQIVSIVQGEANKNNRLMDFRKLGEEKEIPKIINMNVRCVFLVFIKALDRENTI